jgi:Domain of unknown function (DUF222)
MFESRLSAEVVAAAARFPELAAAIAAVPVRPPGGLSGAEVGADVRALLVLSRQLEARLSGHVACFDEQGLGLADAAPSTLAWLRSVGRVDSRDASTLVRTARVLTVLPQLAERFAEGAIGAGHVAAVVGGAARVPDAVLALSDKTFADFAGNARPSELRRVAKRVQACHDEASVADDAAALYDSRHLGLAQTFDDAWHLEGKLDPEGGSALEAALTPLMGPRGPEDTRNPGQRRADALVELVQVALRSAKLPECGRDRPRLTLTLNAGLLGGALLGPTSDGGPRHPGSHDHADNGGDDDGGDDDGGDDDSGDDDHAGHDEMSAADLALLDPDLDWLDRSLTELTPLDLDRLDRLDWLDRALAELALLGPGSPRPSPPDPDTSRPDTLALHLADLDAPDPWLLDPDRLVTAGAVGPPDTARVPGGLGLAGLTAALGLDAMFAGSQVAVGAFGDRDAHLLGSGVLLPTETVQRICCDCDINITVQDAAGEVLHEGRTQRLVQRPQRRAVNLRDGGCVFPGCDRKPVYCQAHHVKFWGRHGGRTDVCNLALVCSFHHHLVHEGRWTLERRETRDLTGKREVGWLATSPDGRELYQQRRPPA